MKIYEKEYYTLIELVKIVNIKYRQLKERIKIVFEKYKNIETLIFKKSNRWFIHSSIIDEFKRKRKKIQYKYFVTISSKNRFERDYWKYIILRLNKILKGIDFSARITYVIELKYGYYHLHFKTTFSQYSQLRKIIKNDFFTSKENDMNTYVIKVWDEEGLKRYFSKQYKPVLLK